MTDHYDDIVIGVGGMGSATSYRLAERGRDVLGLERFDVPHAMGSSHGVSRIIRLAYYEDPAYVPLIRRAYELWEEIGTRHGEQLLFETGSIDAAPADDPLFEGSRRSCEEYDIDHEVLTGAAVNERYPGYDIPDDHMAVYQPNGGYVLSERAIVAHTMEAQREGARIQARERVTDWEPEGDGVRVRTDRGEYTADNLVITAGAWAARHVDALDGIAIPQRQVLAWLQPDEPAQFAPENFPVWNLQVEEGRFYGLPIVKVPGFKFGRYMHREEDVNPDSMNREPEPEDERLLREFAERYFPAGTGPTMGLATCLFTNTPDGHFVIDRHPECPQVVLAAGFTGHGYKFASVIGEVLADLASEGRTDYPIDLFSLDRFDDPM
ncbi:N-methyl-L-tryptophan oxidase [Halalkalicoccus jeotgali]|uniref:N-methyltryptophan oxidase n=1 Tax=Halalkalicoccus jeotgali (strain DSM 18796 / CECT 7217 / JCM 14584 / KCTC 4019 / B3) TaxID=795797 RepID=D8J431_HALJB|nr:N-methyl-L-tryptophan oxidase [Halalkalicoccus jeotgali]ADJ15423.1 N-methyltryptophan oxidase [Halalkalicoccus jeotgali B3]ELY35801.1 N-methyltryptophan oxidase [Halalkalicoccus jeotgali B3]